MQQFLSQTTNEIASHPKYPIMAAFGFPFDQAADMIIRSNDGHEFTVHRIMIESAFKDVIGTTDGRGVLNLPEKGQTLDNVLRFVYGHDFKVFAPKARAEDADKDLAAFAKTCDAAEKVRSSCTSQEWLSLIIDSTTYPGCRSTCSAKSVRRCPGLRWMAS